MGRNTLEQKVELFKPQKILNPTTLFNFLEIKFVQYAYYFGKFIYKDILSFGLFWFVLIFWLFFLVKLIIITL